MISPGFHSPDSRLCVINALICWYNGLKVGDGAAGAGTESPRPAALGCLRRSDSRCSPGSMSWRAFHHKPRFSVHSFSKTSVLYKTYDTV
jgi:hypothetical protein